MNTKKRGFAFKIQIQKGNPSEVKSRMAHLEQAALETQAVSFDKEKKIMKEINSLKNSTQSVKVVEDVEKN